MTGRPESSGAGPSPRVRGAGPLPEAPLPPPGTIPAGAGSSRQRPDRHRVRGDHPRGCGEQGRDATAEQLAPGPSPRVRGAVVVILALIGRVGTIPAGAGSRRSPCGRRPWAGDHPRGCGEQPPRSPVRTADRGPSPRVRGAGSAGSSRGATSGTIPAGAGSSPARRPRPGGRRDHPRGCGEQGSWPQSAHAGGGGGPPPRGGGGGGTIPAGAGSRVGDPGTDCVGRDHPRGCGEQTRRRAVGTPSAGPSPRVRGAVPCLAQLLLEGGTIPAGAGSRTTGSSTTSPTRDHPRGCGEQEDESVYQGGFLGPSPRVRGAESEDADHVRDGGTIPAGAGSRLSVPE